MSNTFEILELGNPILREKARHVTENIKEQSFQELIDYMISICSRSGCVGIAAPQVGYSIRLFIVASKPSPRYPNAPLIEPTAIINPSLSVPLSYSGEMEKDWEGCLSIPGIRGQVSRFKYINVSFTNRKGKQEKRVLSDFVARVFQHEFDHINGVLIVDRVNPKELVTDKEHQRIISEESTAKIKRPSLITEGTRVITTRANEFLRDTRASEVWEKRKWGILGTIICSYDSHGLCYDIRHEDGSVCCYDPTEFKIV